MMYYKRIQTPLGSIRIEADNKGICNISFCQEEEKNPKRLGRQGLSSTFTSRETVDRIYAGQTKKI